MTPHEIIAAIPGLIADIENQRGDKLTPELIGSLLIGIGESIRGGNYATGRISPQYFACTCPVIVPNNPASGRIDPMLCLCESC